jgi:hypothetical protein
MAEYTLEQIEAALRQADAAGDTRGAEMLAQEYRRLSSSQAQPQAAPVQPQGVTQAAIQTQQQAQAGNEGRGPSNFGQAFIASQPSPPTRNQAVAALLEVPRTLGQNTVAYAAGMARSLPVVFQEDSDEALKVLHDTMASLSYVPETEEGKLLIEGLAKATAPLAWAVGQIGNPGGVGNEYLGEWIQSGFAMVTGTGGLRRIRKGLPKEVEHLQSNGWRPVIGERRVGEAESRSLAASLGGKDATNSMIVEHNQRITNMHINQRLGLPESTKLDLPGFDAAYAAEIEKIRGYTQAGGRVNGEINRALLQRERAAQLYADGDKTAGDAMLNRARATEARIYNNMANKEGDPLAARRAQQYRDATDRLNMFDTVYPFIDYSGDVNAPGLRRALSRTPQRIREGVFSDFVRAYDEFPSSFVPAGKVSAPSAGATMFDIMMSRPVAETTILPAAAAGAVAATGGGLVGAAAMLGGGIATILAARRLGRKYGSRAVQMLEARIKPNLREGRAAAATGASDERKEEEK